MAKGGDLWEDSVLINAFDHAISSYKKMHKKKIQDLGPDNGEVVSVLDNNGTELKDKNAVALRKSVEECNELPLITEDHVPETSVDGVRQEANFDHHSAGLDYYNQLLGQYYELEASRQKIYAAASPMFYPISAVPCTLSACSVVKVAVIQHHENAAVDNCGIKRTAMEVIGKAMSSLKVKAPTSEVADKEARFEGDRASSSTETDITDVLNAWYTAGFYTGKYLTERSAREKPRG